MRDDLERIGRDLIGLIPEVVLFLVILLVGYFVSKGVSKAVRSLITRVHRSRRFQQNVNKMGPRSFVDNVSVATPKVAFWVFILFTLYFAFSVFGANPITVLLLGILAFLPKLVVALIIVVIAAATASAVKEITSDSLSGLSYNRLLANLAGGAVLGIGVFAALIQVGIATAVLLPVLYAILLTVAGVTIVGVGGALIRVLRPRLESAAVSAQNEFNHAKDHVSSSSANVEPVRVARPVRPLRGDSVPPQNGTPNL